MAEGRKMDHILPGGQPKCDLCDTESDFQLSECLVCKVYMCKSCTDVHQRDSASKQHNIVVKVEREPSELQNVSKMCKLHEQEEITYCTSCSDYICSECILGNHTGHDCVDFNYYVNKTRREMIVKLNKDRDTQNSEIAKLTKQIELKEKENDDNDKETESKMQTRKKEIIEVIDRIFSDLAEAKSIIHQQNKDKLRAVKTQLTLDSPEFNKICSDNSEVLHTRSDMEVDMSETTIYHNLVSVSSVSADIDIQINKTAFVAGKTDEKTLLSILGYIHFCPESSSTSQRNSKSSSVVQPYFDACPTSESDPKSHPAIPRVPQSETDVQVMSTFCNKSEIVFSICPLSDDTAIINYYKSCNNDIVSVDGQIKKTLKLDFVVCDFIMTSHGDIMATDYNKSSIHKLTKEGRKIKTIRTAPLRPARLCEASDGNLLVSFVDKPSLEVNSSSRRLVSRMTMDGTTLECYEYHNGSRLLTWPHGVSENINKDICVVDRTSTKDGRLVVLDYKGQLKCTYQGQNLSKPFHPIDVKCDKSGHMIVNDRINKKVHVLDMGGQFIRYIVDEHILKDDPCILQLDKNNILWIGGDKGNVYRLKYLK